MPRCQPRDGHRARPEASASAGERRIRTATISAVSHDQPRRRGLRLRGDTVSGVQFDASAGRRDVAMWFWAPRCENCNHEAPSVAMAVRQLAGRVTFVGVGGRDDVEPMREFLALHALEGLFSQLAAIRGDSGQAAA